MINYSLFLLTRQHSRLNQRKFMINKNVYHSGKYKMSLKCETLGLWGGSGGADLDAQQEVLQLGQCSGEGFWCWWKQLLCVRLSTQH